MEHKLAISPYVYIMLPAALLVLPIPWALGWCIAVFVHELGHYIALRLCRVPICLIEITPFGICMHTGQMSGGETLLCALAGPLFGLLLLGLSSYMPYTALCAFLQSLFNLLPIYPMDGGRALRASLGIFRAGEGVFSAALEEAAAALDSGQISGILESEEGFSILRRGETDTATLAVAWLDEELLAWAEEAEVLTSADYEEMDVAARAEALEERDKKQPKV